MVSERSEERRIKRVLKREDINKNEQRKIGRKR
jgi:hypothetical protein